MAIVRAQVILPKTSGLPADAATNTWHFITAGSPPTSGQLDEIHDRLGAFYSDVRSLLSNQIDMSEAGVKMYDVSDPTPRVPLRDTGLATTGTNTGDPHPSEVALVLSFHAITLSGDVGARRRGRIYLGPLSRSLSDSSDRDRPDTTSIGVIRDAADDLVALNGSDGVDWAIYSPTDGEAHNVVGGWIDNAFDTQRRRGVAPTTRTTFTVA